MELEAETAGAEVQQFFTGVGNEGETALDLGFGVGAQFQVQATFEVGAGYVLRDVVETQVREGGGEKVFGGDQALIEQGEQAGQGHAAQDFPGVSEVGFIHGAGEGSAVGEQEGLRVAGHVRKILTETGHEFARAGGAGEKAGGIFRGLAFDAQEGVDRLQPVERVAQEAAIEQDGDMPGQRGLHAVVHPHL